MSTSQEIWSETWCVEAIDIQVFIKNYANGGYTTALIVWNAHFRFGMHYMNAGLDALVSGSLFLHICVPKQAKEGHFCTQGHSSPFL